MSDISHGSEKEESVKELGISTCLWIWVDLFMLQGCPSEDLGHPCLGTLLAVAIAGPQDDTKASHSLMAVRVFS